MTDVQIRRETNHGLPKPSVEQIIEHISDHHDVRVSAVAELPTRYGHFQVVAFHAPKEIDEHAALVHGDISGQEDVPVRLHSECLTGDVFMSYRCDCRQQLEVSMEVIQDMPMGAVLYLRQEGRGIGLENKIRAYQLQEVGFDTNEANVQLGFREDERDYKIAAQMLEAMGVRSIQLISNNPDKLADLKRHGVKVTGRIPIQIPPNKYDAFYLETKRRSGHLIDKVPDAVIGEQLDCVHRTSNKQVRFSHESTAA
jgi:GTP cyclohydrolase II